MNRVLEARGIVAGYRPDLPILHGVSLEVGAGEVVTIIGPNGAGKSTFVKAVAGLVGISDGRVEIGGRDTTGMAAHRLADAGVGYVPQTGNVFTTLTIQENLVVGGSALPKTVKRPGASTKCSASTRSSPKSGGRRPRRSLVASARCSPSPAPC
jgi:ABC-type branched-subunit amino acid transport system ATPase component